MQMVAQGEAAPLTAEQMRETVSRLLQGVNSSDPKDLARELFRYDGDFTAAVIDAVPRLVSAAAEAVKAFAESLEGMPTDESVELVSRSYARVDGREIGEALNALSRLVIKLHEQNPELFPANRAGVVADFMQATDFGKLRKALTYRAGEQLELLRREVEIMGGNPLALINLFSVVAPVINDSIVVMTTLLDILALPPEAMAYALCKILEDIDWEAFTSVINGTAALVVSLHRGNLVLGDGSLFTRGPLTRIGSDFVRGLDGQAIAEAIAAVGEEGEALITSFAGQVLDDQDLVVSLAEAAIALANSSFKAAAAVMEKASSLPPETMARVAGVLEQGLETAELGRALDSFVSLGRTLRAEDPGVFSRLAKDAFSALPSEVTALMSPRGLGSAANQAVAAYNEWSGRNPGQVAARLDEFLGAMDTRELERAARTTGAQLIEALTRHPEVLKMLAKTALSTIYSGARGYVAGLRGRRKKRGGG